MTAVLKSYPDNIYDLVGKIKEGDVISLLNVPNSPTLTVHAIIESRKSRGVFKNELIYGSGIK